MGSRQRRLKSAIHAAIAERNRLRGLLAMYAAVAADMQARHFCADDVVVGQDHILIDLEAAKAALAAAIAAADAADLHVHYYHRRELERVP